MMPFSDPMKVKNELIGSAIIFFLIAISNMAGISGAFNIIPMMMLFNDMSMKQAVPLASFSAMCASLLRYVTNFKQRHPAAPDRTTINYEIVEISLSLTFLGTFLGVQLAKVLGEIPRAIIFCLTIAWAT